jgi:hypothetical protein
MKTATIKRPDPNSKRSARRRTRGFRGLLDSSRKHRRAQRRQLEGRFFNGKLHEPGQKADAAAGPNGLYTGAGSLHYH